MFTKRVQAFAQLIGFITIILLAGYGILSFFQNADNATAAPEVQESSNGELSVAAVAAASEFVPNYVNYQGVLRNAEGNPLTGAFTMDFRVYSAAAGGTPLWEAAHQDVAVRDGYFSILLGSVNSAGFTSDIFNGQDRYIGVTVTIPGNENNDEMVPRQHFVTVPYAYRADRANGLTSANGTEVLTTSDNGSVLLKPVHPNNRVKLNLWPLGDSDETHHAIGTTGWHSTYGPSSTAGVAGGKTEYSVGHRFYVDDDSWVAQFGFGSAQDTAKRLYSYFNGRVGIGTDNPLERLHVVGNQLVEGNWIRAQEGAKTISLRTDGTEVDLLSDAADLFIRSRDGKDVVINSVGDDGNVGIGTSIPATKLHVKGTARFDGDIQWNGSLGSFKNEIFVAERNLGTNVSQTPVTMTPVEGSFCALTDVNIKTPGQEQTVSCHIWIDDDNNWELRAYVANSNSSGRAYCEARCLRWDNQ